MSELGYSVPKEAIALGYCLRRDSPDWKTEVRIRKDRAGNRMRKTEQRD